MTRDEIVTALRCCSTESCDECPSYDYPFDDGCIRIIVAAAADLIENQQRHIEALMKANAGLRDTIMRRDKQIEDMKQGMAQLAKAVAVKEEQSELHAMKNELCQYCGKYKHAHDGSCDGCKWRDM